MVGGGSRSWVDDGVEDGVFDDNEITVAKGVRWRDGLAFRAERTGQWWDGGERKDPMRFV